MASLTIRNLEDPVKAKLRLRAAGKGHSMEEEARVILREALASDTPMKNKHLGELIRELFAPWGGVDLPEMPRGVGREPPDFSK